MYKTQEELPPLPHGVCRSHSNPMGFLKSFRFWSTASHSSSGTSKRVNISRGIGADAHRYNRDTSCAFNQYDFKRFDHRGTWTPHPQKEIWRWSSLSSWTTKHYCFNRVRAIALTPTAVKKASKLQLSWHCCNVRGEDAPSSDGTLFN